MPQGPNRALVSIDPDGAYVPLNTDADGNLLVAPASGAGEAVTIADGADATQGAIADAAWTTGSGTVVSLLKAMAAKIILAAGLPVRRVGQKYVTVAAGQTAAPLGTGAIGDTLSKVVIVPATTSPGVVSAIDAAGTPIVLFAGGASSLATLQPVDLELDMISVAGGWSITTGTNVSVVAVGNFTP